MLVHFLDFAQLNSVRSLPYVVAWQERYRDLGLSVLGVHSPRWPLTADRRDLDRAVARLGVAHPVAADLDYAVWHDYGCEGWPSLFLWGRGGALRWFHFGEGAYSDTELAIQEELRGLEADDLPAPLEPVRPTDAPEALVIAPTPEVLPGGALDEPWSAAAGEALSLDYEAGGAFASLDGDGQVEVSLDGAPSRAFSVDAPGLYELTAHPHHERHQLRLDASPGVRVWSISFAPGVPPPGRGRRR